MLSQTLATFALGAITSSILPCLGAPTQSAVPLTFSYVSTQGHGNTNLSLVEGDYGYAMQELSVPATISAYVGSNTLTMACPHPGLQAALIPASDGVTWNFQWVDGSEVGSLPQGSRLDAFSIGGRATWADTTDDPTVNTTLATGDHGDWAPAGLVGGDQSTFVVSWVNKTVGQEAGAQAAIIESTQFSISC